MPISITSPIIDGMLNMPLLSSSAMKAPPRDKGTAERMVSGWKKSWNSSTSTQNTHSRPMTMAMPKPPSNSIMISASPVSISLTLEGMACAAGKALASASAWPSGVPPRSALTVT